MADFLSFQVVVDLRFFFFFFFAQNLGFFVAKIGVERLRVLNFVTSTFIYLF